MITAEERGVLSDGFEKHLRTGVALLLTGLMSYIGLTVSGNSQLLATLTERSVWQSTKITELTVKIDGNNIVRYTAADASRDKELFMARIAGIERRIVVIESGHGKLVAHVEAAKQ